MNFDLTGLLAAKEKRARLFCVNFFMKLDEKDQQFFKDFFEKLSIDTYKNFHAFIKYDISLFNNLMNNEIKEAMQIFNDCYINDLLLYMTSHRNDENRFFFEPFENFLINNNIS